MFFAPNWPLPKNIKALCTTREGGVSQPPFDGFNLATHVGDDGTAVAANRKLLVEQAKLPTMPFWLDQQHTDIALRLDKQSNYTTPPVADASWTMTPGVISVVMTADCLPILLVDKAGTCVCTIHAGWKGLADGIVSKTILGLPVDSQELIAWIGPAISPPNFEVGSDVLEAFTLKNPEKKSFFKAKEISKGKYLADLPGLVALELEQLGVPEITQSQLCSYENSEQFYSYRRDGQTGRMASMIWIEK